MLATWGLSLFLIGLAATVLGYHQEGVAPPLGSVEIGAYAEGGYTFFVIGVAAAVLGLVYIGLKYTRFGLIARRHDAERRNGVGSRRGRRQGLCGDLRSGRGPQRPRRRGARADRRRTAGHRRHLRDQGVHHRDRRRRRGSLRNRRGVRAVWCRQPGGHFHQPACGRRGSPCSSSPLFCCVCCPAVSPAVTSGRGL